MKLTELKSLDSKSTLTEGVIPPHISMTLAQVLTDGKITNNVQTFIIAGLISLFKDGGPTRWPRDLNSYSMSTSSDLIDAVKNLSDSEVVEITQWLVQQLQGPVNFETNPYMSPQADIVKWMQLVLHKQD